MRFSKKSQMTMRRRVNYFKSMLTEISRNLIILTNMSTVMFVLPI